MMILSYINSYQIFQLLQFKPLLKSSQDTLQFCNNKLQDKQAIGYCFKANTLSSQIQTAKILYNQQNYVFHSLYIDKTQDLQIDFTYAITNMYSFALFGLTNSILIKNSNFSVKVPTELARSALICFLCDLNTDASDFVFVATAYNISGIVFAPTLNLFINNSLIQFRLNGIFVGGLIQCSQHLQIVIINNCNISGLIEQTQSAGSLIAITLDKIVIQVESSKICMNNINYVGIGENYVQITGQFTKSCNLCRNGYFTYGLCQSSFDRTVLVDQQLICQSPFVFDGEQCSCPEGELNNGSSCVNVINSLSNLLSQEEINQKIIQKFEYNISNLDYSINNNVSILNHKIVSFEQSQQQLEDQISNNLTILNLTISEFKQNQSSLLNLIQELQLKNQQQEALINNLILQISCTNNVGYSYTNGQCVKVTCSISGQQRVNGICQCTNVNAFVYNDQCTCPQYSSLVGSICTCPQYSNVVNGVCVCNVVAAHTMVSGICTCPVGQTTFNGSCWSVQIISNADSSFQCNQYAYISSFDIQTITNQIAGTSDFSNGYVFSTSNIIQNAYIVIPDNVYSTLKPLFQSQSSFTNIKIQIGIQTLSSGNIVTPSTSIIVNQMNIISRDGSQISVSSASTLSLLTSLCINANIKNLLVNLNFASSSIGSIALINTVNGVLNITGFQILGTYVSTLTVAMIGVTVNSATLNINSINFKPSSYNVGNSSSFLFSSITSSTASFNYIAFVFGVTSSFQLTGSISSTSSNFYQFGGIITNVNANSPVTISNMISDCYQSFSTSYVSYSGLLIGNSLSSINISNVCQQQKISSTTKEFNYIGFIGQCSHNLLLQQIVITLQIQATYLMNFGITGQLTSSSNQADILNIRTSVSTITSTSSSGNVGAIFGSNQNKNCSVINTNVINCNFSSQTSVGGLIGEQASNLSVIDSVIQQANVSGQSYIGGLTGLQSQTIYVQNMSVSLVNASASQSSSYVGGLIGYQSSALSFNNLTVSQSNVTASASWCYIGGLIGSASYQITITKSKISGIRIVYGSNAYYGIILGFKDASGAGVTFSITSSSSSANYFNNVLQADCTSLTNNWSKLQC
ncbi:Hypothetical_protein [Hexamita inflata]|uniref:Hypothetical_protein n=1 Tax=Hexamita inflata TaxID=28002 RepID=A0ABP1GU07_9EUKA